MLSNDPCTSTSVSQRSAAYTTVCMDIVDLVPHAALQILDVGCSNAAETAKYLDYVANADLNGFDWDAAFGSRRFDCIIFADVLEHLVDPSQCLEQALKRLQPGGSIVVSLPNIRHISAFWAIFFRGNFPKRSRGIFDSTHLRWFRLKDAQNLLAEQGLTISEFSVALRWGDSGFGEATREWVRVPSSRSLQALG